MQLFNESRKRDKKVDLFSDNSDESRLLRKLVGESKKTNINQGVDFSPVFLNKLVDVLNEQISENEALHQILPDIKLASQVLISGILSPKDLTTYTITYRLNDTISDKNIISNVIKTIKEFFDNEYKLIELAPAILKRVLFTSGSYPILVLPETTVDSIINSNCVVTKEEYKTTTSRIDKTMGFLSSCKAINGYTSVTDNFNLLKKPWLNDKRLQQSVEDIIFSEITSSKSEVDPTPYLKRRYSHVAMQPVHMPSEDGLYGEALTIKLPSESTVPVYVPGDPSTHVGYFILLDKNGYPVNGTLKRSEYDRLKSSRNRCSGDGSANLIRETKLAVYGDTGESMDTSLSDNNQVMYSILLEKFLSESLKSGAYGEDAELADISKISNIMLARALSEKHTTILYVPKELVVYFAFDYNKSGIGKSLLDDGQILASMRSVLMLANTLASIKNSVPRTGVKINLDPNDPDPQKTVEFLLHEFLKNHNQSFPVGLTNPSDISDAIQRSSIDVVVTGNSAYPETSIDVNDKTRSVAKPDTDLENQMRRMHYMSMGLPPEIIDADMNIDFAAMIVSSNLLTTKAIAIYQELFTAKLSELIRRFVKYSSRIKDKIAESIGDNEDIKVDDIIQAIEVSLPEPDNSTLENQMAAFRQYTDSLNVAIESYFSSDMLGRSLNNDLEDAIEPTMNCIKAYYQRQWLRANNVLPELESLIDDDSGIVNLSKIHKDHLKSLIDSVGILLRDIRKEGRKWINKLDDDERKEEEKREMENEAAETPTEAPEEELEMPTEEEGEELELPEEAPETPVEEETETGGGEEEEGGEEE